jgi:hypothetical protein
VNIMRLLKELLAAPAIVACSVIAGICTAYALDALPTSVGLKPLVFYTPFVVAVVTGVALLRLLRLSTRGDRR